jgi:nitrite reductase/ring-hydroxylating ferredoxin subunit
VAAYLPHGRVEGVIFLCRIDDLSRTGAKGIVLREGDDTLDIVVVEAAGKRHAYINSCPHQFIPLETFPDHFFDEGRTYLVCSGHGALFLPENGFCVHGPCESETLDALAITEHDGAIYLDETRTPGEIARAKRSRRNW